MNTMMISPHLLRLSHLDQMLRRSLNVKHHSTGCNLLKPTTGALHVPSTRRHN